MMQTQVSSVPVEATVYLDMSYMALQFHPDVPYIANVFCCVLFLPRMEPIAQNLVMYL